eukprot:12747147-Alexandrium_andersonii.AAC.1
MPALAVSPAAVAPPAPTYPVDRSGPSVGLPLAGSGTSDLGKSESSGRLGATGGLRKTRTWAIARR